MERFKTEVLRGVWGAFDTLISTFFAAEEIVFAFESKEDMSLFIKDQLEPKMPHIRDQITRKSVIAQYKENGFRMGYLLPDEDPAGAFISCPVGVQLTKLAFLPSNRA